MPTTTLSGLMKSSIALPSRKNSGFETTSKKASGFIYYVSIAGITGTKSAHLETIASAVGRIKHVSELPVVTGFGIRTPEQAATVASVGDGAIVGSAVVEIIADASANNLSSDETAKKVARFAKSLSVAIAKQTSN